MMHKNTATINYKSQPIRRACGRSLTVTHCTHNQIITNHSQSGERVGGVNIWKHTALTIKWI